MLPELVFQDVLYGLYIMICSPLHLHGTEAWRLVYLDIFRQPHEHSKSLQLYI